MYAVSAWVLASQEIWGFKLSFAMFVRKKKLFFCIFFLRKSYLLNISWFDV
jgi:hypothetical protein